MSSTQPSTQPSSPKYMNPHHCILESAILEFHTKTDKIPQELLCNMDTDPNTSFGCLEIHVGETTINIDPVFFLFSIDESGSMSEMCKDGKTKMEHIHFTMNQMLLYFAENPEAIIYVHVNAFDDKVRTVIETTQVTSQNVHEIIEKIKKIRPQGSTNFDSALKSANQIMQNHAKTIEETCEIPHRIVHIFLTDGNPTVGDCSESSLTSLVDDTFSNVFIAFGLDHNAILMNKFGNVGKNTTNYLVSELEFIGFVYGEIVHNHLFKVLDNTVLEIEEGSIYDWISNEWKTNLNISALSSESKKFYYVKSTHPYESRIKISGRPIDRFAGEYFEEYVDKLPDLIETSNTIVDVDLTKHILRLCTQRLLYEARSYANREGEEEECINYPFPILRRSHNINYNDDQYHHQDHHHHYLNNNDYDINDLKNLEPFPSIQPPKLERNKTKMHNFNFPEMSEVPETPEPSKLDSLKSKIKNHLKYMSDYLRETSNTNTNTNKNNNDQDKQFIKTLCDDMEIALKTIGTRNQQSYINARSSSQGRQQMYNVNINDDDTDNTDNMDNTIKDINNAYATPSAIKLMRGFSNR